MAQQEIPLFLKTSLEVQWLRLRAPNAGVQVQFLVGELRFYMLQGMVKNINKKVLYFSRSYFYRECHFITVSFLRKPRENLSPASIYLHLLCWIVNFYY